MILPLFIRTEKEISWYLDCFIKPVNNTVSKILRSILTFLILFGTLLTPLEVRADFFSSLFGNDAFAKNTSVNPSKYDNSDDNSQTIELFQAQVSFVSSQDKKDPKSSEVTGDLNGSPSIVSDNAISPAMGPMGVSDGKNIPDSSTAEDTSVYVVRKGDSISQIADMFNISVNTILAANDLKKGTKLVEGDVLFILPISGLEHTVKKGQTLQSIAKLYNVGVSDIISYNDITDNAKLVVGDQLMIPNAEIVESEAPVSKPKTNSSVNKIKGVLKILVGYFINPVPGYKRLSQGLHGNNGVDLAAPIGTPIVAAASGTVLLARNGYNGGYGNMVIIEHPNGTQTLYGHQSRLATKTGAKVSQGETIGYVGSTGHSTGPHLHFEVHGARNPGVDL